MRPNPRKFLSLLTVAATVGALMLPASASYINSVVAKPAPEVAEMKNAAGEAVAAVIKNVLGIEVGSLKKESIKITPMADLVKVDFDDIDKNFEGLDYDFDAPEPFNPDIHAMIEHMTVVTESDLELYSDELEGLTEEEHEAKVEEIKQEIKEDKKEAVKQLAKAFDQITKVDTLMDLDAGFADVLAEVAPASKPEDMVIKDVFDVSVPPIVRRQMAETGASIDLAFQPDIPLDVPVLVMHNYQDNLWETIPRDRVTRNTDGTIMVNFPSFSPIAFVVDKTQVEVPEIVNPFVQPEVEPETPTSPQTNAAVIPIVIVAAVVVAGVAVVLFKKSKQDK